jgi:hypothetical protein
MFDMTEKEMRIFDEEMKKIAVIEKSIHDYNDSLLEELKK